MPHEDHLLDLEQPASVFCYNYSSLKEDVCISTAALSGEFEIMLYEQQHFEWLWEESSDEEHILLAVLAEAVAEAA